MKHFSNTHSSIMTIRKAAQSKENVVKHAANPISNMFGSCKMLWRVMTLEFFLNGFQTLNVEMWNQGRLLYFVFEANFWEIIFGNVKVEKGFA